MFLNYSIKGLSYFHHRRFATGAENTNASQGTAAAATATAEQQAEQEAAAAGEQVTVSKADFEALKTGFADMKKTLNGLAAEKRVAEKAAREAAAKNAANQDEGLLTLKSLKTELDAQKVTFNNQLKEAENTFITSALKTFTAGEKMDETQAEGFEACLMRKYSEKITVKGAKVFYTDEFGEEKPFSELCKHFITTPLGKTFLAPVETPGETGSRTQQGVKRPPAGKDFDSMTAEEQRKNPRAAAAAIAQKYQGVLPSQVLRS